MTRRTTALVLAGALALGFQSLAAQGGRQGQRQGSGAGKGAGAARGAGGVSPAEVQRMFDSYAMMQAQEQLKISNEQFPQFLARFKALLDLRRKGMQDRTRIILELRRLVNEAQPDDAKIKEQLKELGAIETRIDGDTRKAFDAIDQLLDVRQQAKFRIFEENMERRKLELVTRARQANRPKSQQ